MMAVLSSPWSGAPGLRTTIRTIGFAGLGIVAVLVGIADVITKAPPGTAHTGPSLAPPSPGFAFGTDLLGRDMLGETLHALVVTVDMATLAMLVTLLTGALAGFAAARLPWRLGFLLRWVAGTLKAVPPLFLAVLFIGIAGRQYASLLAGLATAPVAFARAFDRARSLAASAHADFARATGVSTAALLRRDLVYEFRAELLSVATRALAAAAIILSTASFFGFVSAPPNRDLGLMLAAARDTYIDAWWTAMFPAIALALVILFARLAAGLDEGERP